MCGWRMAPWTGPLERWLAGDDHRILLIIAVSLFLPAHICLHITGDIWILWAAQSMPNGSLGPPSTTCLLVNYFWWPSSCLYLSEMLCPTIPPTFLAFGPSIASTVCHLDSSPSNPTSLDRLHPSTYSPFTPTALRISDLKPAYLVSPSIQSILNSH